MKKILSVIILVMMALGMPIYLLAAADTAITQDSQDKSGNTNIDYNMEEAYTVVIPASVTFTDREKEVERGLLASDVVLSEGSALNIKISSANGFQMKNGEGSIDYGLLINTNIPSEKNNYTILTVHAGESSGWAILTFYTELDKTNAIFAGHYTDTLTFTVSVD